MKDPDIRPMGRPELEDEVMLQRAKVKVLENTIYSLRKQLAALTCACCDPPPSLADFADDMWCYNNIGTDVAFPDYPSSLRDMFPSDCPDRD